MAAVISSFLAAVREVRSRELDARIEGVDRLRRDLEVDAAAVPTAVTEGLAKVARFRLLASNTLRTSAPDRRAWDAANAWLAERAFAPAPLVWNVTDLTTLNGLLRGAPSRVRVERIESCGTEYLAPEFVGGELARLEEYLATTDDHPLRRALTSYVAIVTIHPFENANGRTARLAGDGLLLREGYLPLTFPTPISSHVAQTDGGLLRDPLRALGRTLGAVERSYELARAR